MYFLDTFGCDCYGNASGYCVRKKGEVYHVEMFPWNIYRKGSDEEARQKAITRINELNSQKKLKRTLKNSIKK